jgi:hypothetical protein
MDLETEVIFESLAFIIKLLFSFLLILLKLVDFSLIFQF